MRNLTVKRKKHFIGSKEPYTLTVTDALGKRNIKLQNGQVLTLPVDDGEVKLKVSATSLTGYAESDEVTVPAEGDMEYKIETGYSVYFGSIYKIKRIEF